MTATITETSISNRTCPHLYRNSMKERGKNSKREILNDIERERKIAKEGKARRRERSKRGEA